jgi:hypothetical protein
MAGLVPAIHVFVDDRQDVDARHKAGHDEQLLLRPDRVGGALDEGLYFHHILVL